MAADPNVVKTGESIKLPPPQTPPVKKVRPRKGDIVDSSAFRVACSLVGPHRRGSKLTVEQLQAMGCSPSDLERLVGDGALIPYVEESADESDEDEPDAE